jgi:hypothetical protein
MSVAGGVPLLEQGFECSDMDSFFSSVTGGFRNEVEGDAEDAGGAIVRMAHGTFRLRTRRGDGALLHEVEVLERTWIYDAVARWVLPGEVARFGRVGGEVVPRGSELYHEHAVGMVELDGTRIGMVGRETLPRTLRGGMYLRCEEGRWIVHARAVAGDGARMFLKGVDGRSVAFGGGVVEERVMARRREFAAPVYGTQVQPHVELGAGMRFVVGLRVGGEGACGQLGP